MKIIILGAGQVGGSIARILAAEPANDVTVIDTNLGLLLALQERTDLRTIHGYGAYPDVLERAGGKDADMLIAVTSSDEVNMVACEVARTLFNTTVKIARIRSQNYAQHEALFGSSSGQFAIDRVISPETLITRYIQQLLSFPGALQVFDFAKNTVCLVSMRVRHGRFIENDLKRFQEMYRDEMRIAAIYRQDEALDIEQETTLYPGDEVFFLAALSNVRKLMQQWRGADPSTRKVMLAGAGSIGLRLAQQLEKNMHVKLIECDAKQAKYAASLLPNSIVLHGDCSDEALLQEENVDACDVYCAITNDEEVNILSAMLVKRLGTPKVISLINRESYLELTQVSGGIDIAISPSHVSIGELLRHIRRGGIVRVHSIHGGAAEALEAIAHEGSPTVGRKVGQVNWPEGANIIGLVRNGELIFCDEDTLICAEDRTILFVTDKRCIAAIEKIFQVSMIQF